MFSGYLQFKAESGRSGLHHKAVIMLILNGRQDSTTDKARPDGQKVGES